MKCDDKVKKKKVEEEEEEEEKGEKVSHVKKEKQTKRKVEGRRNGW